MNQLLWAWIFRLHYEDYIRQRLRLKYGGAHDWVEVILSTLYC